MNRARKFNYNSVNKFIIVLCVLTVFNLAFSILQNYMFYQANKTAITFFNQKIDINNCSFEALISLPGIGKNKALDIIESRPHKDIHEIHKFVGIFI